jgi:hypothetical protein
MMWDVPGIVQYMDLINAGHSVVFWADVYSSSVLTSAARFVEIVSGNITADYESDIRYTGSVVLNLDIDSEISTIDSQYENLHLPSDLLNIYSTRIALYAGINDVPGSPAADFVVPLGMYRVESATWGSDKLYEMELSGFESYVIDYTYEHPISIAERYKGMTIIDIIKKTIAEAIVNPTFDTSTLPPKSSSVDIWRVYDEAEIREGSRWETVKYLAQLIDCVVYAGPTGAFHITERPSRKSRYNSFPAVWSALMGEVNAYPQHVPRDGRWSSVLKTTSISVSRDDVFNGVVVYNQSNDENAPDPTSAEGTPKVPVYPYGIAIDVDPDSPVNWFGPFGKKPYRIESDCVDAADCMWKAYYLLNDVRGNNRVTSFSSVPNYALEPGDIIYVEEALGSVVKHQIKSISYELGHAGDMSVTTAAKSELRLLTWEEIADHRSDRKDGQYVHTQAEKNAMVPTVGDYIWNPQQKAWSKIRQISDLTPKVN